MYKLYPLTQEELKSSLENSFIGGRLTEIVAAGTNDPTDAMISDQKNGKSVMVEKLLRKRKGIKAGNNVSTSERCNCVCPCVVAV